MANLSNERFTTGNHVAIFARGDTRPLGLGVVGARLPGGTTANAGINTGARPVHVIGDAEPQEIVDGAHTYEFTLSSLHLRDVDAADRINAGDVEAHLIDRFNGKTLRGCHLVSSQLNVSANQLLAENLSFQALSITG